MQDRVSPPPPDSDLRRTDKSLPVLPPMMALVEIFVLFALLTAADIMYPAFEIADLRPHPYWIPVLLLSLQYGTVSGLTAAAVAVGFRAYAGFPEQGGSETYFSYLLKIWIEPILWIAAAVVLGQFRMRQISRQQDLIHQVNELANQRGALADYAQNLRSHCSALERQIAGRSDPGAILLLQAIDETRSSLSAGEDGNFSRALSRLMDLALPGAKATLYLTEGAGLRIIGATGPDPVEDLSGLAATDALFQAIAIEGRGVSVLTPEGEKALAGAGLAAAPIFAGSDAARRGTSPVIGMIKIEHLDPALLTPACVPALATIGFAFAPALQAYHAASGQPTLPVPEGGSIGSTTYKMLRRLRWFSPADRPGDVNEGVPARKPTKAVS